MAAIAAVAAGLSAVVPAVAADPPEPVVQARWVFDGDAVDVTGNGHDGTVGAGVVFQDGAAVFSNSDSSEITIPHDPDLEPSSDKSWTLELEGITPGALTGNYQTIVQSRGSDTRHWIFYIQPTGAMVLWAREGSALATYATGVTVSAGSTYNVAITRAEGRLSITTTGAAEVSKQYSAGSPVVNPGTQPIRFGNGGNAGTEFFYRGSLGGASITTAEIPSYEPPDVDLVASWEFDGDAADSIGGHHGTASAAVSFVDGAAVFAGGNTTTITVPYSADLEPAYQDWMLELDDVTPGALTGAHQAIISSRLDAAGWVFYIMPDGLFSFWYHNGSAWQRLDTSVKAVPGQTYDVKVILTSGSVMVEIGGYAQDLTVYLREIQARLNPGSQPLRMGHGGGSGTEFFYNGSLGAARISTGAAWPGLSYAGRCGDTDGFVSAVTPIDWNALDGGMPDDAVSDLAVQVALNAARYGMTTWWDSRYAAYPAGSRLPMGTDHDALRGSGSIAVALAVLLATGQYDEEVVGVSEEVARSRVVQIVSSAAYTHEGNGGAWEATWGKYLWSYLEGFAAWLVWDDLDPGQQMCVERMVAYDADHHPAPGYYRNAAGTIINVGNTQAEENTVYGTVVGLAAAMMPTSTSRGKWLSDALLLDLSGWAVPSDVSSSKVVNGRVLSEVLNGSNVEEDGTVLNHSMLHPAYMVSFDQSVNNVLSLQLAGELGPAAAANNIPLTYSSLSQKEFASPPYRAPGGTIYVPGSAAIYYPQGNDYGANAHFPLYYAQADVIADSLGLDEGLDVPALEWAELHLEAALAMQARHADGHTYADASENNYSVAEERAAQIAGHIVLTRWLNSSDQRCLTNRPYTTGATDPVLGELEVPDAELAWLAQEESLGEEELEAVGDALAAIRAARVGSDSAALAAATHEAQGLVSRLAAGAEGELASRLASLKDGLLKIGQCVVKLTPKVAAPVEAQAGGQIEVLVTGASRRSSYDLTLEPDPGPGSAEDLGRVEAADGTALVGVTIPPAVAPGAYTLRLAGQGHEASTAITVTPAPSVDKSDLSALAAGASALVPGYYTSGSWSVLESALSAARVVLLDDAAGQASVDGAAAALELAWDGLAAGEVQRLASVDFRGLSRQEVRDAGWAIVNENPENIAFGGSGVSVTAEAGELWGSNEGEPRNILRHSAPGDWDARVHISTTALDQNNEQALVGVFGDVDNYVKLTRSEENGQGVQMVVEDSAAGRQVGWAGVTATDLWLRLVKVGDLFTGFYSLDGGGSWVEVGSASKVFENPDLVLVSFPDSGSGDSVATFSELVVVPVAPPGPDVSASVAFKCAAGRVYFAVTVVNDDVGPVSLALSGPFGSKSFASVGPGRKATASFNTLTANLSQGGALSLAAGAAGGAPVVSGVDYGTYSCGG
ncbi:MAG: hypothetical protein LBG60_14360 [Bifidobacteriaceae bacterium]|jgi:hypothetical protein|nr:hypothetical protein [Bifidobacteriaceae bacterium]